ncbi:MAG: hypothetical protein IT307_08475 [Chloroflexi bacterium]|nr:hypothetical protein [Chloroflexota bacterium]
MKGIVARITSKGQVTTPAEVRKYPDVGTRDRIAFVLEEHGEVRLKAPSYPRVSTLRGAAGSLERPVPWRELRELAREDALEDKERRWGATRLRDESPVYRHRRPDPPPDGG